MCAPGVTLVFVSQVLNQLLELSEPLEYESRTVNETSEPAERMLGYNEDLFSTFEAWLAETWRGSFIRNFPLV